MADVTTDRVRTGRWRSLERRSATAFVVGGLLMVVDAGFVAVTIGTGSDESLILGQAFVGAAWTAAFVGVLGLYPGLADRSRWLARAGAVFAVIGVAIFAAMTVAVLGYYAGIPAGEYGDISVYFIPGVFIGSVLGFVAFGTAVLRSGAYSRTLGVLLLVPAALVVANILRFAVGMDAATITLAIVIADALAMLSIGYVLRAESGPAHRAEPGPVETRHG